MGQFHIAYPLIRPYLNGYLHFSTLDGLDAAFTPSFSILQDNEGFYANHPEDLGKETYAGIARAFFPLWDGWPVLDRYKKSIGRELRTNEIVPGMEPYVRSFYEVKFKALKADQIVSQDVANIFFDFYILAAKAVATMQEVLRSMGQNITVDNKVSQSLIDAINRVNPTKLYNNFRAARIKYHQDRVASGAVSATFLPGWIKRTMKFPELSKSAIVGGVAIAVACGTVAYFLLYPPANEWIKKQYNHLIA